MDRNSPYVDAPEMDGGCQPRPCKRPHRIRQIATICRLAAVVLVLSFSAGCRGSSENSQSRTEAELTATVTPDGGSREDGDLPAPEPEEPDSGGEEALPTTVLEGSNVTGDQSAGGTFSSSSSSSSSGIIDPPELPSQTLTVTVTGPSGSEKLDWAAVRSIQCIDSCTIELFSWGHGPNKVEWSSVAGEGVQVLDGGGCVSQGVIAMSGSTPGQVCEVLVRSSGNSRYRDTDVTVLFKGTAAVVYAWSANALPPPETETNLNTTVVVTITIDRSGTDTGRVNVSSRDTSPEIFESLGVGTHQIRLNPASCDRSIDLSFGVDMAGTMFGSGTGKPKLSWPVVCDTNDGGGSGGEDVGDDGGGSGGYDVESGETNANITP